MGSPGDRGVKFDILNVLVTVPQLLEIFFLDKVSGEGFEVSALVNELKK